MSATWLHGPRLATAVIKESAKWKINTVLIYAVIINGCLSSARPSN
jgi:hypothetical protein